jgi:hypothetical protein
MVREREASSSSSHHTHLNPRGFRAPAALGAVLPTSGLTNEAGQAATTFTNAGLNGIATVSAVTIGGVSGSTTISII